MYRLLALDLDGTLLRSDHRIDESDRAAIAELQAAGVTVTIITGRLSTGALGAARACSIEGAIGCVEGSHLLEVASNRTLAHHGMSEDVAALVRGAFVDNGLTSFVFDAEGIHHDHTGAPYAPYVATWSPNMRVVEQAVAWQTVPLGAVGVGDAAAITEAHAVLKRHADQLFSVAFTVSAVPGKHALLVRAAGPTKGTALAELCARAGCTVDEAVCVGDWLNDVPMFDVAGRSFAMGGACEEVASRATDVLARQAGAGGGIAEAIRRAWG